jgi:hypothetical protein
MTGEAPQLNAVVGGLSTAGEQMQVTCANPKCGRLFTRVAGRGRPADHCSPECRREAHTTRRVLRRRLAHHEGEVEKLRRMVSAIVRSEPADGDDADDDELLDPEAFRRAEDAVLEARTVARFLKPESGEYASEYLGLFRAVEPVIEHYRRTS